MQARQAQGHFEKTWRERRKRYYIDGADETGKLKRFGLGAHRLRTAVARLLEWFRICLRHGWIIGYAGKRNTNTPKIRNANKRLRTIGFARRWQGLDLPYGPQAFVLGLAATPDVPPARPSPTNAKERDGTGDSDDSD